MEDNQGPYRGSTRVGNHCCNCDIQDAVANLANEVARIKAEILGKIYEFPKQVEEVISNEMLVIKRAITEDLWKVMESKVSATPTPHNVEDSGKDGYFSDGEKWSSGEEEDVFSEEDNDVEDTSEDGHLEALIQKASEGSKGKEVLHISGIDNPTMKADEVFELSDDTDSLVTRKREPMVVELENSSKKFKSSHGHKVGPFSLRKHVFVDEFKLVLFLFSNKQPSR